MKTRLGLIILAGSLPLLANQATLQLSSNLPDGAISPYYSTINGVASTAPNLYCDDVSDQAYYNTYNVQIDTLQQAGGVGVGTGTGMTAGRFSTEASWAKTQQGLSTSPAATNLYDEAAWLFAQIAGNSGQATAIQEAAWDLFTNATSVPDWPSLNSPENTSAADWLKLAASTDGYSANANKSVNEDGVTATLSSTNYSNWFVADAAPTCTGTGPTETCGALPSTDSAGDTWQEFLIYSNSPIGTGGGGKVTTPEPATFGMLGCALLFGGLFGRRKSAK